MLRLLCANRSTDFVHLFQKRKEKAGGGDGICADRLRSSLSREYEDAVRGSKGDDEDELSEASEANGINAGRHQVAR